VGRAVIALMFITIALASMLVGHVIGRHAGYEQAQADQARGKP